MPRSTYPDVQSSQALFNSSWFICSKLTSCANKTFIFKGIIYKTLPFLAEKQYEELLHYIIFAPNISAHLFYGII